MYIHKVKIANIRSLRRLQWELPKHKSPAGWHVIVGDNGSGKTSFLRSIALGLVGPETALQLRQPWEQWLRRRRRRGYVALDIERNPDEDQFSGKGKTQKGILRCRLSFAKDKEGDVTLHGLGGIRHVWGKGDGWFSASYGPLRRFTGGDPEKRRLFYQFPRLGRHLSSFDESVALSECLEWLKELRFKELEQKPEGAILPLIRKFVNQRDFLPFRARLTDVSSEGIIFEDGSGAKVEVENLSDGYRSILSMTFELIRQMTIAYGPNGVFDNANPRTIVAPGVVLIDEIDAHLHPTWQRRIGVWFREHFPRIQFIVTSHSPLVCQAADTGTIYRLPRPGSEDIGEMVEGDEYQRLVFGNVLDAYGTEVFGQAVTSSSQSRLMRKRLAELNVKEMHAGLTSSERAEQKRLRRTLPTAATSGGEDDSHT